MSKVGFGGYRISVKSEEHEQALKEALAAGVSLIDTSSNYTDGDSERLIGKVLKEHQGPKPLIVSKVGYIQGSSLSELDKLVNDKRVDDIVHISAGHKHCIHPLFIEDQIEKTLQRLELNFIDVYLLHNPEYYLKTSSADKQEYYRRIQAAFEKLEELVDRGLIGSYGISSNTFVDPKDDAESTDLDIVMGAARDIKVDHNFKYIQFPLNILEMGALERQYGGNHLVEQAAIYNLTTIINRPLNCFTEQGLLRLANYPVDEIYKDEKNAEELFNKLIQPLVINFIDQREDEHDKLFDIPLMKQISTIWYKQNSPDAVDQVFQNYFFPFIAKIYGKDLTPVESKNYYKLYDHAVQFSLARMNKRAEQFESKALDSGLLFESDKNLSKKVIEKYSTFGVDYILVGMKKSEYVSDLKEYF